MKGTIKDTMRHLSNEM